MNNKTLEDFQASIATLRDSIDLFKTGKSYHYRTVATELRKLMCDPIPKRTLLPRVFKDLRLHRLHVSKLLEERPSLAEGLEHMMPGRLSAKDGRATFRLTFSNSMEQISLEPWLNQPLFSSMITVKKLIRDVANKEAVHSDFKLDITLEQARKFQYIEQYSHVLTIVAIGEYLLDFLSLEKPEMRDLDGTA